MKKDPATLKQHYFDDLYNANVDPWDFEKSDYERKKYAKTIESLPKNHYDYVLEIGCSIGVLTQSLLKKCSKLLAIDISEPALETARKRLAKEANVTIKQASIPDSFPTGNYDLVLVSEVGYYLSLRDLIRSKELIKDNLRPDGDLVLVHWTHDVKDYPLSGDQVHEVFLKDPNFTPITDFRTKDYRLNVMRKN